MSNCAICDIFCNKYVLSTIFVLVCIKIWYKATMGECRSKKRMNGKTVIVTGANSGIGKETARDLARRGARVILACRNLKLGKEAQDEIIETTGNKNVVLYKLDLASLSSVREFARTVIKMESRLDVLVNNAGAGGLPNKKSVDGLQILMQVNHFGPFLLTILLLDLLKKSAPSRIIMVSSLMHHFSTLKVDNLNYEKSFSGMMNYADSKLANILMANELARKLKGTGVTSNSLHPGVVMTHLWRQLPSLARVIKQIARIFFKTSLEGAQTSIYLAVSEDVEGVSGKYFVDCKEAYMSRAARNEQLAKKVWEKSEELVSLKASERLYL
ncbi:retinol dehydrogenase 11 isoform X2 [Anabrus simplex]|uniref:retinol dehydrogenase 11 isoform X2 n=1 Tax=Anabrus simplex TaxID=316456 RepID=UPI0035A2BF83